MCIIYTLTQASLHDKVNNVLSCAGFSVEIMRNMLILTPPQKIK